MTCPAFLEVFLLIGAGVVVAIGITAVAIMIQFCERRHPPKPPMDGGEQW